MNVFALQVDSNLTSFVTALSEISSVTDPTYGPDADAVVVGMNSVSPGSGENSLPTALSSVTYEDVVNLCDCPECQSG